MLTKELLRFRCDGDRLVPQLLAATPAQRELAASLLAHWQGGVGRRRGDLEDAATPIMHRSRALIVAKGLHKLIVDRCTFADPASTAHLRSEALALSATVLSVSAAQRPVGDCDAHRAAIAARLGTDAQSLAERLYGDLPDAAILEAAPAWDAQALIAAYNLALCQGLLLHARRLDIAVADADTGRRRRLLTALRFRHLLAEVRADHAGVLRMEVSGPGAVLDQASRYGLQLALFLPALACCTRWTASAEVAVPRDPARTTARLELSADLGLPGDNAFLGHVPAEVRQLSAAIVARQTDWTVADAQLLPLPTGELVVPDLQVTVARSVHPVELFHRWHGHALRRRLDQLAQGLMPQLVIGVDRALVRSPSDAALAEHPAFLRHGFLFTDIPTPRGLVQAIERLHAGR